jgi:hypothetical protein
VIESIPPGDPKSQPYIQLRSPCWEKPLADFELLFALGDADHVQRLSPQGMMTRRALYSTQSSSPPNPHDLCWGLGLFFCGEGEGGNLVWPPGQCNDTL